MGRKPAEQKKWQKRGWWRVQPGRKLGQLSGKKSQTKPREHSASDLHARLVHGSAEWKLVRLLELVKDEKQKLRNDEEVKTRFKDEVEKHGTLPRHFLRDFLGAIRNAVGSHQRAQPKAPPAPQLKHKGKFPHKGIAKPRKGANLEELRKWAESGPDQRVMEIYTLTRDLHAELDNAIEYADADGFERMARAIRSRSKERPHESKDRFDAAVVRAFEESRYKDKGVPLKERKRNVFTTAMSHVRQRSPVSSLFAEIGRPQIL